MFRALWKCLFDWQHQINKSSLYQDFHCSLDCKQLFPSGVLSNPVFFKTFIVTLGPFLLIDLLVLLVLPKQGSYALETIANNMSSCCCCCCVTLTVVEETYKTPR
jgi:hypothetical protein